MQQWSQWSQSVHFKIIRHPTPLFVSQCTFLLFSTLKVATSTYFTRLEKCSGSFQSESVRRTPASLRRVCIHSKCPLQNYGTSSVFTPSYRPPSWMATMPLPSLPCKHFVKSCHMFMTHQQPGGWVWAHLSQSKLLPLFYASPILQFLDFNQPTAFTSCLIPCKYPLRRSNMKYGRLWFIYSFCSCLIWKGGFHVPIPNSGPKQF